MRAKFLILLVLPVLVFGQVKDLIDIYGIPSYSYHTMNIFGQDFLNYQQTNYLKRKSSVKDFTIDIGLEELVRIQTPTKTKTIYGLTEFNHYGSYNRYMQYDYRERKYKSKTKSDNYSQLLLYINSSNSWYPFNEKGFSYNIDGVISELWSFDNGAHYTVGSIPLSIGYGRIIGVKNVVQSSIISDEIKADLSNEQLLELSEVIEKYNEGVYYSTYRDSAKIKFYDDIEKITNRPGNTIKIQEILDSPIYKTAERFKGWNTRLGFNMLYLSEEYYKATYFGSNISFVSDMFVSIDYYLPISSDKQFGISSIYSKNLDDELGHNPFFRISSSFSIEHNYHWTTQVSFNNSKSFPKNGKSKVNTYINAKTDYILYNALSIYASFDYGKIEFEEYLNNFSYNLNGQENIQIHLGFNYYLK